MDHTVLFYFAGGIGGAVLHFLQELLTFLQSWLAESKTWPPKAQWRKFLVIQSIILGIALLLVLLTACGLREIQISAPIFGRYTFIAFCAIGYLSREVIDKVANKGRKTLDELTQ